ncbi:hypothetical protein JOM56_005302 [Amanita muscaria]
MPRRGVWERLPPSRDLFGQLRARMLQTRCVGAFAPLPRSLWSTVSGVWERLPPSRLLVWDAQTWCVGAFAPLPFALADAPDALCGSVCPPPAISLVNCERCVVWERLPPSRDLFGQLRVVWERLPPSRDLFGQLCVVWERLPPSRDLFGQLCVVWERLPPSRDLFGQLRVVWERLPPSRDLFGQLCVVWERLPPSRDLFGQLCVVWERLPPSRDLFGQLRVVWERLPPSRDLFGQLCVVWERLPPSRDLFGQLCVVWERLPPSRDLFGQLCVVWERLPPSRDLFGQLQPEQRDPPTNIALFKESAPSVLSTANGKPNGMAVSSFGSLRPSVCLTAQTAKKSTGGSAERVWLKPPAKKKASSNPNQLPEDSPKGTPSTLFCYLCQDGGLLTECDQCSRSVCKNCLDIPPEFVTLIDHPSVDFLCVGCHWLRDQKAKASSPYVGFPRLGKPVLPSFLKVRGKFELGTAAHPPDGFETIPKRLVDRERTGCQLCLYPSVRPDFVERQNQYYINKSAHRFGCGISYITPPYTIPYLTTALPHQSQRAPTRPDPANDLIAFHLTTFATPNPTSTVDPLSTQVAFLVPNPSLDSTLVQTAG